MGLIVAGPEPWSECCLGELGIFVRGRGVRRSQAESGPLPCVRYGELYTHHEFILRGFYSSISRSVAETATRLQEGDVLFAGSGETKQEIGKCAAFVDAFEAYAGGDILILRAHGQDPTFMGYYCNSPEVVRQKASKGQGDAVVHIGTRALASIVVRLPPVPEQREIAAVLRDVDTLLERLDKLIAKKRDLKQAAMQRLLTGQTRLPGLSGEWEVKRLSEIGDIRSGGTPSTRQPHFWDGDVPWCTPTDITALSGHKYLTTTARNISAAGLQSSSAEVIPARSLIITSRATIGACAINLTPMTTNQGFKSIVPVAEIDVEFLYYLMTTQESGLVALCGGSTFLEISKKQLSAYEIRIPTDRTEQVAISAVLSDIDAELAVLDARRHKTQDIKLAMMQELLTGKTRLHTTGGPNG